MIARSRELARQAHAVVRERLAPLGEADRKAYLGVCAWFPIVILQQGLLQGLAVLLARARPEQERYARDLLTLLVGVGAVKAADLQAFQGQLQQMDIGTYQGITRTALDACGWLKQYARAASSLAGREGGDDQA